MATRLKSRRNDFEDQGGIPVSAHRFHKFRLGQLFGPPEEASFVDETSIVDKVSISSVKEMEALSLILEKHYAERCWGDRVLMLQRQRGVATAEVCSSFSLSIAV